MFDAANARCILQPDSSGVSMVSPFHLQLFFCLGFTTRSTQLSHFSASLAVTSDFAVTFGLVEHAHTWQAEIGAHFVLGSVNVRHACLYPVSDAPDARGRWALQTGQFRCQHGILFSCSVACCPGSPLAVSDQFTLF